MVSYLCVSEENLLMNQTDYHNTFLQLVRLGIGTSNNVSLKAFIDWPAIQALATQQRLLAIALDGIDKISLECRPQKKYLLQWIGVTLQQESQYATQKKSATEMAILFHHNSIKTYVLKGEVVAECYPNPVHRCSSDLDCFLVSTKGVLNAWDLGNELIKNNGFEVENVFYKNSTLFLPGLVVENHKYLTPFRGNRRLSNFERLLQSMLHQDKSDDRFEGTWLYRPPVMVSALFMVEHAYSHFLHEGLTWRHVLDWMMFSKKHQHCINWEEFSALIKEFGFRKFYETYIRLGKYLLGEISYEDLTKNDYQMLDDIWAPLDLHESVRGFKGKLALVGNTWRARWKYRYFTNITWVHALWIQVKGFLFMKEPKLD